MKEVLRQLKKWPPTTSTVFGIGLLIFGVDYLLTGNLTEATSLAGAFGVLCPEDASAASAAESAISNIAKGIPHA